LGRSFDLDLSFQEQDFQLARSHFDQGNYQSAEELASKAGKEAEDVTRGPDTTQVLLSQARLAAGGTDVFDMQIPAGNAGQSKARAKYLPAPFAHAAIYENRFHIIPRGTKSMCGNILFSFLSC